MTTSTSSGGRFEDQNLSVVDWAEADHTDGVFVRCTFEDVVFASTVFAGARFERCQFRRCRFSHADLREAVLEDCQFADPVRGAAFSFSRLDASRLLRCDLTQGRFDGCDLYEARFESCNLLGAAFPRSSFARTFGRKVERFAGEMVDCNLELADLAGLRLPGGSLARSRLREADISGADLEGTDLAGVDLFQAVVDNARLAGADLRGAEVSGLDLRRLASYRDLKIAADQQFRLLDAMGIDVRTDER